MVGRNINIKRIDIHNVRPFIYKFKVSDKLLRGSSIQILKISPAPFLWTSGAPGGPRGCPMAVRGGWPNFRRCTRHYGRVPRCSVDLWVKISRMDRFMPGIPRLLLVHTKGGKVAGGIDRWQWNTRKKLSDDKDE